MLADGLKLYLTILYSSGADIASLQSDSDKFYTWCSSNNSLNVNVNKIKGISIISIGIKY